MALSKTAVEKVVLFFFARRGMLPVGTTAANWRTVTMAQFQFDDPPINNEPHFVKKKISQELQTMFNDIGIGVSSPLPVLKRPTATLGELTSTLHESQTDLTAL